MSDSLYKNILHGSTFGFTYNKIISDERGKTVDFEFLDVNSVYADMIGLPRGQIINRRVTDIIHDVHLDSFNWIECFGKVALSGERIEFEEYSRILDRWYHMSVMCPEKGFFVALSFDITEKRKAELSLIISEERNRKYIDNAPDAILITDKDGKYTQVNPAAAAMLGYTREELTSLGIADITPEEDREATEQGFKLLAENGRESRKTVLLKKNGDLVNVLLEAVALPEAQFMAFFKDITKEEALAGEKEQYYSAFQSTSQPIIISRADGSIITVNRAFTEMYGYVREEVVGQNPRILNPGKDVYFNLGYTEDEYAALFEGLWKCVLDPSIRTWEGVVINRKKNGSLVWVNLIVNAVFGQTGKIASFIALPIDITNSRELEDRSRLQLYKTIADLAELRDDDTGNHMRRVGIFTRLIAKACGMNEKFCADIELFSPMHDIGKVGILDSILQAPRRLTPEEFEIMKTHALLGHTIFREKKGFEMAAELTLSHHEKFDGTGYPSGISGNDIPLSARITALADVYDALRSARPYKEPWTHEEALAEITAGSGNHFDPDLVDIFLDQHIRIEAVFKELMD